MKKNTKLPQVHPEFWSGAMVGTLTGIGSLLAYQYFRGILRQPRLISKEFFLDDWLMENEQSIAMLIAAKNLQSGIQLRYLSEKLKKQIVHAGYRNFRESWARDFGFTTYGLLALQQFQAVRDTLDAYFWYQTVEGQLPVKLHSISVITRFFYSLFGREQPTQLLLKPKYSSGHGTPSLDGQAMLINATCQYAQNANDTKYLNANWESLKSALKWLERYRKDPESSLLYQEPYADWADSIAREGPILYTNVVYWKALKAIASAAEILGLQNDAKFFNLDAERLSQSIIKRFWRPDLGYFVTSDSLDQLSSAGNLLAIAWDLALPEQAEGILAVMDQANMTEPLPTRATFPSYPRRLIAIENIISGVGNYHTEASWLWIGAWHVIALAKLGQLKRAREVMDRIGKVIVRDKQVNEVFGPDGKPLSSFWYKSESPLIWNAGMIVYAYKVLQTQIREENNFMSLLEKLTE